MEKIWRIVCPVQKDPNEIAISCCFGSEVALIFTTRTRFCPTIQTICEKRQSIFFTEDKNHFEIVTKNFDGFDAFIFVNRVLNDFEREFFRQLGVQYSKRVIEIVTETEHEKNVINSRSNAIRIEKWDTS